KAHEFFPEAEIEIDLAAEAVIQADEFVDDALALHDGKHEGDCLAAGAFAQDDAPALRLPADELPECLGQPFEPRRRTRISVLEQPPNLRDVGAVRLGDDLDFDIDMSAGEPQLLAKVMAPISRKAREISLEIRTEVRNARAWVAHDLG